MTAARKLNFAPDRQLGFFVVHRAALRLMRGDLVMRALWSLLQEWAAFRPHARRFGQRVWALDIGQLVTAERALADELGAERSRVRRALARLEAAGLIATARSEAGTLITVNGSDQPSSVPPRDSPSENPHHRANHLVPRGAVDPQGFDGEAPERAPAARTREKQGSPRKKQPPTSSSPVATMADEEGGVAIEQQVEVPTPPEHLELLSDAQVRLGLIASREQRADFLAALDGAPAAMLERLRDDLEWLATGDPRQLGATFSIQRLFHVGFLRKKVIASRIGQPEMFRRRGGY